jgi:hypothetical protein
MSDHPNAILMVALKPDGLSRKTFRDICDELKLEVEDDCAGMKLGEQNYHGMVLEDGYDESSQIEAAPGDIVFWNCLTYGYGDTIFWADVVARKERLEEWAKGICERHKCSFKIYVTANYW